MSRMLSLRVRAKSQQQSLRGLRDRRGAAAANVALDHFFANFLARGVHDGAFQGYRIILALQRFQPEDGRSAIRIGDHRSQAMLDGAVVVMSLERHRPMRAVGGRGNVDILRVAIAARRFHPMREPMPARQRDHLRHFGGVMEEMSIRRDGDCGRPGCPVANRVSQRERTAFRRLNPTEHRRSIRCDGPIGLQAARPGWVCQRGGRKSLAESRQRQHGAEQK